ncbi:aminotransferase [Sphingomonas xanthus]|uniref:aspartate transaminase n=1 Tax=Sphingomonas xanthus TaxID=2594473 RepID=A0A516IU19_9SPHN|nr:aminotransferase [Sphingomonas xanthus]QDP20387.1 aminotransferase [Sphingomonas xanthus]
MHPLYQHMATSVFERMSLAAAQHGAVNLGQGFPDFGWPVEILDAAARALKDGSNQYAPSRGLPALREAIAGHYAQHQGLKLGVDQVCVTSGATEALAAAILATVEPGDEVILFTPAYDAYAPLIRRAGGIVREVPLQPPGWRIERAALQAALSPRTKAIVLNNPHNPTGRLFDREELSLVAEAAVSRGLTVISDEVWEHVLLDGQDFTPISAFAGMAERTLKCGSAGKIFSLTGWKIGWLISSPELATLAARAHQFLTFASAPNLQAAVAYGLAEGDGWLRPMRESFSRARDRMTAGLEASGYAVLPSASTYFLCVDLAASGIAIDAEAFADQAVERAGVAVVPLSPFAEHDPPRHMIRLCFAKRDETIDVGVEAMAKARTLFA